MCPDAEETVLLRVKVLDFVESGCLGKVTLHGVTKTQVAQLDQLVKACWEVDLPPAMELAMQDGHLTRLGQRVG